MDMARTKRREWTETDVRDLEILAREKMPAEKSLADSVRLWLVWKGVTERHTPVRELRNCSPR